MYKFKFAFGGLKLPLLDRQKVFDTSSFKKHFNIELIQAVQIFHHFFDGLLILHFLIKKAILKIFNDFAAMFVGPINFWDYPFEQVLV